MADGGGVSTERTGDVEAGVACGKLSVGMREPNGSLLPPETLGSV